jgi:hypothetical protein
MSRAVTVTKYEQRRILAATAVVAILGVTAGRCTAPTATPDPVTVPLLPMSSPPVIVNQYAGEQSAPPVTYPELSADDRAQLDTDLDALSDLSGSVFGGNGTVGP